jgi:hypothetical protein
VEPFLLRALAAGAGVGALGVLYARFGHHLLTKDPHTPTERFGFHLREEASRARVAAIIEGFFTGYNGGVAGLAPAVIRARVEALPPLIHPFAFEGSGMGHAARALLRPGLISPARFEEFIAAVQPGYRFMFYIGLGVWSGFRGPSYALRAAGAIGEPKYGGLIYDGFGFKTGFFHRVRDPQAHAVFARLPAKAALPHAYQGYGRSLWFVFRDDPAGLREALEALAPPARAAALTGVGLAVTFTNVDRLESALEVLDRFPPAERSVLDRGLRLALFVRDMPGDNFLRQSMERCAEPQARLLQSHLEHARQAYAQTIDRETFLADFTAAC